MKITCLLLPRKKENKWKFNLDDPIKGKKIFYKIELIFHESSVNNYLNFISTIMLSFFKHQLKFFLNIYYFYL